eukprot:Clim_evm149s210 gene=Clim_evmTU149s210
MAGPIHYSTFVYHERQKGGLCAQHCLNNLLQLDYFTAFELATIAEELDRAEEALLDGPRRTEKTRSNDGKAKSDDGKAKSDAGKAKLDNEEAGSDSEETKRRRRRKRKHLPSRSFARNFDDGGNFSSQVLQKALSIFSLEMIPIKSTAQLTTRVSPSSAMGYIVHCGHHWLSLRRFGHQWFRLDSREWHPVPMQRTYMEMYLRQMEIDKCTVFVVQGAFPECPAQHRFEEFEAGLITIDLTDHADLFRAEEYQRQLAYQIFYEEYAGGSGVIGSGANGRGNRKSRAQRKKPNWFTRFSVRVISCFDGSRTEKKKETDR